MTTILSHFKILGAALVLAAGLGATAIAPAVAQDAPPSGFSLGIPENGAALPFGSEPDTGRSDMSTTQRGDYYDPDPDGRSRGNYNYCLDDRQIIRGLRDYGFQRVQIVRYLRGERVEATAYWGRTQYSMRIDRCSGIVDRVRVIRRNGFGLQFNFSN